MKKELTSIEIKFLVDELHYLVDSRVEKIYQPDKKELIFLLHLTGTGREILRAVLPKFIWVAQAKQEMPEKVKGFCALLRKELDRSFLRKIEQVKSERIIKFEFEAKEGKYSIYLELFSKGNAILCKDEEIIMPLEMQEWKDRLVKKGEKYAIPSAKASLFEIKLEDFKKVIIESKETISKTLATRIGTGGVYAEEICLRAGIDKKNKEISDSETKKLYKALNEILKQKPEPAVVLENDSVIDIVPIKLQIYSNYSQKEFKKYSQALDSVLSQGIGEEKITEVKDKFQSELDRISKKIEMQKQNLEEMQAKAMQEQKKGEMIYEKYQEMQKLLETIKELRKKHSWKEIKEKLKSVKYIKNIDEKTGEITLSL